MNVLLWIAPKGIFLQDTSEALKGKEFARLSTSQLLTSISGCGHIWSKADLLRLSHSVTKLCNCAWVF